MNKARNLLEVVKEVKDSETQVGSHEFEYDLIVDLSGEVAKHRYSDDHEMADTVLEDIVGNSKGAYLHDKLHNELWNVLKNVPGVAAMDLELSYERGGKTDTIDAITASLKKAQFKLNVIITVELSDEAKAEISGSLKKVLDKI